MTNQQNKSAYTLPPAAILHSYFALPGTSPHYLLTPEDRSRVEVLLAKILPEHSAEARWAALAECSSWSAEQLIDQSYWERQITIAPRRSPERRDQETIVASLGDYSASRANACDLLIGGLSLSDRGFVSRDAGTAEARLERARSAYLEPVDMLREILSLREKSSQVRSIVTSSLSEEALDELCTPEALLIISPEDQDALTEAPGTHSTWLSYHLTVDDHLARKLYRARLAGPDAIAIDPARIYPEGDDRAKDDLPDNCAEILWSVEDGRAAPLNGTLLSCATPRLDKNQRTGNSLVDTIRAECTQLRSGPIVTAGSGPEAYIRAMLFALGAAMRAEAAIEAPGKTARDLRARHSFGYPRMTGAQIIRRSTG